MDESMPSPRKPLMDVRREINQKQMLDSTRPKAEHMTAEIQASEIQIQEDMISKLPDDILMNILERLELLRDVVRTCVLSKRWRHLPGLSSKIVLDLAYFKPEETGSDKLVKINASVVEATKSILAHKSQHTINHLSIKFYLMDASIDIFRSVDNAMANREVIRAQFKIVTEKVERFCLHDDKVIYGRRFMKFLDAYPHAFGGLTHLSLYNLIFNKFGMPNVLSACKKLEYLSLNNCDAGTRSVLQIEHPQLSKLSIMNSDCERIELDRLPRLTHLAYDSWIPPHDSYPLTFGSVPQLSVLLLYNKATIYHKNLKLSELLRNVDIASLDLNFRCQRIWIQPEALKQSTPLLRNLQMIRLRFIHDLCDLSWTIFLLEAAPLLKEIKMQVWDHSCDSRELPSHLAQMRREVFKKESDHLNWEVHDDLRHYNLSKVTIEGFQVEEKFTRYIRRVTKAAVNLEIVSLRKSRACGRCRFRPSMIYPRTEEERDQVRIQILDQRSSRVRIIFGP